MFNWIYWKAPIFFRIVLTGQNESWNKNAETWIYSNRNKIAWGILTAGYTNIRNIVTMWVYLYIYISIYLYIYIYIYIYIHWDGQGNGKFTGRKYTQRNTQRSEKDSTLNRPISVRHTLRNAQKLAKHGHFKQRSASRYCISPHQISGWYIKSLKSGNGIRGGQTDSWTGGHAHYNTHRRRWRVRVITREKISHTPHVELFKRLYNLRKIRWWKVLMHMANGQCITSKNFQLDILNRIL